MTESLPWPGRRCQPDNTVQYYLLAFNAHRLRRVHRVMQTSLLGTIANKHKTRIASIYRRLRTEVEDRGRTQTALVVTRERSEGKNPLVAMFGGISLAWKKEAILSDRRQRFTAAFVAKSSNASLRRHASTAAPRPDLSRFTTSAVSPIWTGRGATIGLCGSSGWPHAAARPWSSATGVTRTSIGIDPGGMRGQGTGKPDEIKRLTSGLGRGRRKSAELATRRRPTLPHAQFYERPEVQLLRPTHHRAHYVRDVTLGEDASRIRTRPGVMARIRSVALNVLRANGVQNVSLALYANALSLDQLLALGKA